MERFVSSPNLPKAQVSGVIMGGGYPEISSALRQRGIEVIELCENPAVSYPIKYHADMSAYYMGGGRLILSAELYDKCRNNSVFAQLELYRADSEQKSCYPFDISLNACEIGDFIFCNIDNTDPLIRRYAENENKTLVNINQGYAKCSVCVLDETHIITADSSIARITENYCIDSLLIEPGFFELSGYEYGFIGGSAFKIGKDTIAFTGTLKGHKNEREICEYIAKTGLKTIFLTDKKCVDVGSVIPIRENYQQ